MIKFFIKRPVFVWVIAISVVFIGILCIKNISVNQYPDVALPQVSIFSQYSGASAKLVEQSVTQIIEQHIKGIDNLLFMRSSSDSLGNVEIVLTLKMETDGDIALVQTQNRVQQALPQLPEAVQRQGIQVSKAVQNDFMTIVFYSPDDKISYSDLSDYVASNLLDVIARIQGVGATTLYGGQNAMRIWLDPEKMHKFKLNPEDVSNAIRAQNSQISAGQIGSAPAQPGQERVYNVNAAHLLETVEDFATINLRVEANGSILKLKDIARIELNQENFFGDSWYNGHNSAGLSIKLASGANILETARLIKKELASASRFFPPGLDYAYVYDSAPIIEKSINSVISALLEAIALVVIVLFCFLKNLRATLIPVFTIPIVLSGLFILLYFADFSINLLTLFGMTLAIGLLVDDSIIVVENVEKIIQQKCCSPQEAALLSMRDLWNALIGVAMTISAVFLPMAFMKGTTGVIYRQFSLTIIGAMLISACFALIVAPVLCANILATHKNDHSKNIFYPLYVFTEKLMDFYIVSLNFILKKPLLPLTSFFIITILCGFCFVKLPTSFLPEEDQGIIFADIQLPPGATFERTQKAVAQIENYLTKYEKNSIQNIYSVMGWGFSGNGQNSAMLFIQLKDWNDRNSDQSVFSIIKRAENILSGFPEANIFFMTPPAIMELGNSDGFEMEIMDRGANGHVALMNVKNKLLEDIELLPEVATARFGGLEDNEQYDLKIDINKAAAFGINKDILNRAISSFWSGEYVNDFNDRGRIKKVYIQAESSARSNKEDFSRYYISNNSGDMIPFSSIISLNSRIESPSLTRFQGFPSIKIEGSSTTGVSSGATIKAIENLIKDLPQGYDSEWTGMSWQELQSSKQAFFLYCVSIFFVFLILAALYESWVIPFSVILVLPISIIGALIGAWLFGINNDIYFQLAMLTIVGLSTKNSILIVEYARKLHESGHNLLEATIEASKLRLRPILMTSICFIFGAIPLALNSGAGAGAQNTLGITIIAGMISTTFLGIYYTPYFFMNIIILKNNLLKIKRV